MRRTRTALLVAAAAAVGSVVAPSPAQALGSAVPGTFVCQTSVSVGGVGGTSVAEPLSLQSTIEAPSTSDVAAPGVARVMVVSGNGGSLPASPPVPLIGAVMTQLDARLDVYTTATNSPTGITGAPTGSASGSKVVSVNMGNVAASDEWPVVLDVDAQLPAGTAGQRLWLRLKAFSYHWTAQAGLVVGSTDCRLVATAVPGSGSVEQPLFGFLTQLSPTYPEADTNFSPSSPATYGAFADRVTVTDVAGGPPAQTQCTYGPGPCSTQQDLNAEVNPGTLTQQAAAASGNPSSSAISLRDGGGATSVSVGTAPQSMSGVLNPVTVSDTRGGTAGWSLTTQLAGPLTEVGGGVIASSALRISGLGCAPLTGSATHNPPATGSFSLAAAVTLCGVDPGVDDSAGQSGGGQYTVSGDVTLTVPPYQKAGEYSSTLVITLT